MALTKKTIIYSTNEIREVENNSDRVAFISNYELKYIGTYENFIEGSKGYTLKNIV